jgi:hypothetical protein
VEHLVTCVPGMETQGSCIKIFQISLVPNAHAGELELKDLEKRTRLVENYCSVGSFVCGRSSRVADVVVVAHSSCSPAAAARFWWVAWGQ